MSRCWTKSDAIRARLFSIIPSSMSSSSSSSKNVSCPYFDIDAARCSWLFSRLSITSSISTRCVSARERARRALPIGFVLFDITAEAPSAPSELRSIASACFHATKEPFPLLLPAIVIPPSASPTTTLSSSFMMSAFALRFAAKSRAGATHVLSMRSTMFLWTRGTVVMKKRSGNAIPKQRAITVTVPPVPEHSTGCAPSGLNSKSLRSR